MDTLIEKEIKKLRDALEGMILLCKYNCCNVSYCGRCRIALEALGEIGENGEVINNNNGEA